MNLKVSKNDTKIARGVMRHFSQMGLPSLSEYSPVRGLRVDVIVLAPSDEIWIVECKSSKIDFKSDKKWQNYLEWCDRYFWAVDSDFPKDILPFLTWLLTKGLIIPLNKEFFFNPFSYGINLVDYKGSNFKF